MNHDGHVLIAKYGSDILINPNFSILWWKRFMLSEFDDTRIGRLILLSCFGRKK